MPVTIPVPADDSIDFVPIDGARIKVGTDLLSLWTVQGEVTQVFPPDDPELEELWVYFMLTWNPDGSGTIGVAIFPETPALYPDDWWGRYAIWKRAPKLADGAKLTAADGSKWIYPAGEDGRMRCYAAGSTFARGDRRFRGELTTDPRDLWICDDADWDWLPVTDGGDVEDGDMITFLMANHGVVEEIQTVQDESSLRHGFTTSEISWPLGVWYEAVYQDQVVQALNSWTWFERLPKPAAEDTFRAPDGSRWIYIGGSSYYCWGAGSVYVPGAVFLRGEIAGGLTPIAT